MKLPNLKYLKNFIFTINTVLISVLFIIIFIFTTYLHTKLAKEEAISHANAVSKQVFTSMYQVMQKGWSKEDLDLFTKSLKENFEDSSYSINIYRGQKVVDLFGQTHQIPDDELLKKAMNEGESINLSNDEKIRNITPLIAKQECLKCHANVNVGDTLGVIDIEQNLFDIISESFLEYVLFLLTIIPIFILISYIASRYTLEKINKPLEEFGNKVSQINSVQDFRVLDLKHTDLHFIELNNIVNNVNQLALKLRDVAVDKELLEFEVELLDKFIITSDVVQDWREFVKDLLDEINKIMETYTLMTMFRVGDDQFEVDIFWYGSPEDEIKKAMEEFVDRSIKGNEVFEGYSELKLNHIISNYNQCISNNLLEDIQHETKTLFLDTPKIGGIVGISVQSEVAKDPVRSIVIDSILTTLVNLVGSVKAINKYTNDLEFYAAHDPLTGLFNQRVFSDMMEYEIKRADRHSYSFALMVIDCDNFKPINDQYGHAFGDEFLQHFARLLVDVKRDEDILSRYGGDEFTIILPECDLNGAMAIASRISESVNENKIETPDGTMVGVTVSIGVAVYPEHSQSQKELFIIADSMMYKAKDEGKNLVKAPESSDISEILSGQKKKASLLLEAVSNNYIVPFFQPIAAAEDGSIEIHEILMRINIDDKYISAFEFIETAEQMSLISKMDLMVIENAFQKVQKENYKGYIFINLSPKSLILNNYVDTILGFINHYDIDKSKIVFEITERETVKNFSVLEKFVQNLKIEGFKFAIDDFGSGFSSFHYIKKFPIDFLKIDGEFIVNINNCDKDKAFVKSIVTLAQMLEVKTVAEYVEDEEIVNTLREIGIDYLQGYHIGKPSLEFVKK